MAITPHTADIARPSYQVDAEHLFAPPRRWVDAISRRGADKIRTMPETPPGETVIVLLPDGIDYLTYRVCDAIVDRVRRAGRVIVRGSHAGAVEMLAHSLRRATREW